ncbi:MAG: T9SS type A sorting domain-containing protein [Bacteroidetes bacterium]|nr:T9SS type A sorting domain-containing protein [Bacteroidota bacterium]
MTSQSLVLSFLATCLTQTIIFKPADAQINPYDRLILQHTGIDFLPASDTPKLLLRVMEGTHETSYRYDSRDSLISATVAEAGEVVYTDSYHRFQDGRLQSVTRLSSGQEEIRWSAEYDSEKRPIVVQFVQRDNNRWGYSPICLTGYENEWSFRDSVSYDEQGRVAAIRRTLMSRSGQPLEYRTMEYTFRRMGAEKTTLMTVKDVSGNVWGTIRTEDRNLNLFYPASQKVFTNSVLKGFAHHNSESVPWLETTLTYSALNWRPVSRKSSEILENGHEFNPEIQRESFEWEGDRLTKWIHPKRGVLELSYDDQGRLTSIGQMKFFYVEKGPAASTEVQTSFTVSVYPNPFNPATTVQWNQISEGPVTMQVFDLTGRLIEETGSEWMPAGNHSRVINLSGYASGILMLKVQAGSQRSVQKLFLMK